jgi:O-antigen/teichoic acid export membrane protein
MIALVVALYGVLSRTFFEGVPFAPLAVMLAMVPLGLMMVYLGSVLQSQRKLVIFNIIQGSTSLAHVIAMFIALYVLNGGVMGAVIASTFSVIVPFGLLLIRVSQISRIRLRWDWPVIKQLVTFGLKTHLQFMMNTTVDKMDLPIMNLYLNTTAVGIYSVAMSLVGRTMNLPTAVSAALYPHMVASGSDEQTDVITESACRNLLAMVTTIAVVGALIGQPVIVFLFGEQYRQAYVPFLLLLGAMIPQGSYQILNRNFASRGKPLMGAIPTGIALVVNLVGDFILIPRMGIVGAGVATLAGSLCLITSGIAIYSHLSGRPWWKAVFIQPADLNAYRQLTSKLGRRLRISMDRTPSA